ncbi:MAG TPA: TM0106 family RecB-like putative nuclease [Acidimicrobiales bacterium]
MAERVLTPSKISAWLGCGHYLSLRNQVDSGLWTPPGSPLGAFAELLIDKGLQHESRCLDDYEAMGKTIYEVPGRNANESFAQWAERVRGSLDMGFDVVYQMPLIHEGMRGIADFLIRVDEGVEHARYEPVDAKLSRSQAKPGHVMQLCFYAEAIAALTGRAPRRMHIWLGSGNTESLTVEEFLPYWRRLRRQLSAVLNDDGSHVLTRPRLCESCEYCEFQEHCQSQWRSEDALAFVANSRESERNILEDAGVVTLAQLAERTEAVANLREEKRQRLSRQAALQMATRHESGPPAFEFIETSEDPVYGHGFEQLPAPDTGDVFFDFEGDPFWTPQHDLMFLAGLLYQDASGSWVYDERWAHDLAEQQYMIKTLVEFFARRRMDYPSMHVYHYNHTEKSTIERLTRDAEDENLFASLVETGLFVDLFTVAKNAIRVGTESYGLKQLERLVGYRRRGGIEQGAGAVVEYEEWMKSRDGLKLREIASYNRDDVEATRALRDWLVEQRPLELAWREPVVSPEEYELDTDELVEGLHHYDQGSPEYLLGDLLNYWRRERSADVTPKYVALNGDYTALYDNIDYVTNLAFVRVDEPTGRERNKRIVLTWPEQIVDRSLEKGNEVLFAGVGVPYGRGSISAIDFELRELSLPWGPIQEEHGGVPAALTRDRRFRPKPKDSVLKDLARQVLEPGVHGEPSRLAMALLASEPPRFHAGRGPEDGEFRDDLNSIVEWVDELDESFVAFQGPPGTGKTYSGSHVIHHLITTGKRVGVVAMSHPAIDNLMQATYSVFEEKGDLGELRALRWKDAKDGTPLEFATYSKNKDDLASDEFNLVGGTAWLFAMPDMRQNPVDVLIVDEAGQLALADAVASTNGARNMLLLGDPLQLSQVAKAEHPGDSGSSVLQHVLGEHLTIPNTQGVFLAETWRMHPDVCEFISTQIYEDRLSSNESCERQATEFGTGLRWIEAHHSRRSTDSPEEAELVAAEISRLVGTTWTNQKGETRVLTGEDCMVVAPYNDQVRLLRERFACVPSLAGVQVGTVDKFQGQEAPVVFFTMTTSSADDMPRGPEFLFSRNRLNVAVSRARCLAYLVCTEDLLNSRATDIDDMRLISTLSAFVEYVEREGS